MEYKADDKQLDAAKFLDLAEKVWPGSYDIVKTAEAVSKTVNITAYDGERLVGCLRVLTDGYFFGTITELLVLPEYQGRGIGSRLLKLASVSREWRNFTRKTAVRKVCSHILLKNKSDKYDRPEYIYSGRFCF